MGSGKRSLIALGVAALLGAGSLTGCGGSGSITGSPPDKTTAEQPQGRQSQTAQGDSDGGSKDHGRAQGTGRDKGAAATRQSQDAGGSTANGAAAGKGSPSPKAGSEKSGGAKSGDIGAKPTVADGGKSGEDGGRPSKSKSTPSSGSDQPSGQAPKSSPKAAKDPSECKSKRCLQERVVEVEAAGGGEPSPADQCPTGMSAAECEAVGKMIEEGGGTAETTVGCPAAMSEAECRVLTEAYEAATR